MTVALIENANQLRTQKQNRNTIVFGDLHVNSATLERACLVLEQVGHLAEAHDADIVCVGDFWDLRGHWLVRHVDEVLKRVEAWKAPATFIPGNHDQVTLDGRVHGMAVFRSMTQHCVVTEPLLDYTRKVAYLPWREVPAQQLALFSSLAGNGWTIFAHAEVGGATTNGGHVTPGHVPVAVIEEHARACYLGHYHKRQKLGDRTWYIGSPFAQNMGERDMPHGVALVTSQDVAPAFLDLGGFPRYWRIGLHDGAADTTEIADGDIVELVCAPHEVGTEEYQAVREQIAAHDVRPKVEAVSALHADTAPAFALTLDSAIEQWSHEWHEEEHTASGDNECSVAELIETGRALLGQVPEARSVASVAGRVVSLERIVTQDFCALQGRSEFDISTIGRAIIDAPIATGKTAVLDAVGWCLYGETTSRKAGAAGATLRADAVVHDDASSCSVECTLTVSSAGVDRVVTVKRTKARGVGAKVVITGTEHAEGISDQDEIVRSVIGLSYPLWRACVSLGQGAVSNFVTDTDKRRKELLVSAFGLEACEKAQVLAKRAAEKHAVERDKQQRAEDTARAGIDELARHNFTDQIVAWDAAQAAAVAALATACSETLASRQTALALLEGEEQWRAAFTAHNDHVDKLVKQLAALHPTEHIAGLQRTFGATEAERANAERELSRATAAYEKLVSAGSNAVCGECGQRITAQEQHVHAAEVKIRALQVEAQNFATKLANLAEQIDTARSSGVTEQQSVQTALAESRDALTKCNAALSQFTRVRANVAALDAKYADLYQRHAAETALTNPHTSQQAQVELRLTELRATWKQARDAVGVAAHGYALYSTWIEGFSQKGLAVLILRTALYDLESSANRYLSMLLGGTVYCRLSMDDEDLQILFYEMIDGAPRERPYEKLSGGQRRCVELAFTPFALGDMLFARCGVRVSLLLIDELTTHLGEAQKRAACALLNAMDRKTVLVVDHDTSVQGLFGATLALARTKAGATWSQI